MSERKACSAAAGGASQQDGNDPEEGQEVMANILSTETLNCAGGASGTWHRQGRNQMTPLPAKGRFGVSLPERI